MTTDFIKRILIAVSYLMAFSPTLFAQERTGDPKLTEVWKPEPAIITPGKSPADAPSDAVVLFDGRDISQWKSNNGGEAKWTVADGALTVVGGAGDITTKEGFGDC